MKTKLLLDTNIILDKSIDFSILSTHNYDLYITDRILNEIDNCRDSSNNEIGVLANLFFMRLKSNNNFKPCDHAVIHDDEITEVSIEFKSNTPIKLFCIRRDGYMAATSELKILEIAKDYNLTLITNDVLLRIKALMFNVENKSWENFKNEII